MDRVLHDDLGAAVEVARVRRVVSLVPSLTESVAATAEGLLVGATAWCTHPADLEVVRVRGTKNPDVETIVALAPDLVLANVEENREADVAALRAAGVPVWVTDVRTVPGALTSLARMLAACGLDRPTWLDEAGAAWHDPAATSSPGSSRPRVAVPIWRRPWMVVGRDTFAGDVLARIGIDNVFADADERYPRVEVAQMRRRGLDAVVLPDEPYRFTAQDGPEAFAPLPCALVGGRELTWYGPSLVSARDALVDALADVLAGGDA